MKVRHIKTKREHRTATAAAGGALRCVPGAAGTVPHAVVESVIQQGMGPAQAWRTYLALTQAEVARRLGLTDAAYASMESDRQLDGAARERVAGALGIPAAALDV